MGEPSLSTVFHYEGNRYYGRDLGRAVCEGGIELEVAARLRGFM